MRILENAVTKYYWQKMYRYLYRKLNRTSSAIKQVPGTSVWRIPCGSGCRTYCIISSIDGIIRPVAWLYLWQKPGWKGWEVMQVFSFPNFRGKGLVRKLYQAAIDNDRLMVISGKTQAKNSRGLWQSFLRRGTFDIWIQDINNLSSREQVFIDEDNEIQSTMKIYVPMSDSTKQDIRFIAVRNTNEKSFRC